MSITVIIDDMFVDFIRKRLEEVGITDATDDEIAKEFGHAMFHMVGRDIVGGIVHMRERKAGDEPLCREVGDEPSH